MTQLKTTDEELKFRLQILGGVLRERANWTKSTTQLHRELAKIYDTVASVEGFSRCWGVAELCVEDDTDDEIRSWKETGVDAIQCV